MGPEALPLTRSSAGSLGVASISIVLLCMLPWVVGQPTDETQGQVLWSYPCGYCRVSISRDGALVAAGNPGVNGSVLYLFNTEGDQLWRSEFDGGIRSVSFSPDGGYLAVTEGPRVRLLDTQDGHGIWNFTTGDEAMSAQPSVDARYVIAGSRDRRIYLLNQTGSLITSVATGAQVYSVSATAGGELMVGSSKDGRAYVLTTDPPGLLGSVEIGGSLYDIAASEDGRYAVAGSSDGSVALIDLQNVRIVSSLKAGEASTSVAISSNGSVAVAGSNDLKAYVFGETGASNWSFATRGAVYGTAISSEGRYVAVGSTDRKVYFFQSASSRPVWISENISRINSLGMSADGSLIATGTSGGVWLLRGRVVEVTPVALLVVIAAGLLRLSRSRPL